MSGQTINLPFPTTSSVETVASSNPTLSVSKGSLISTPSAISSSIRSREKGRRGQFVKSRNFRFNQYSPLSAIAILYELSVCDTRLSVRQKRESNPSTLPASAFLLRNTRKAVIDFVLSCVAPSPSYCSLVRLRRDLESLLLPMNLLRKQ